MEDIKFVKLKKRANGNEFIVRATDIVHVSDEGDAHSDFRIVRYMLNGKMELEHVTNSLSEIYNAIEGYKHESKYK